MQFRVEDFNEYIGRLTQELQGGEVGKLRISTMNLMARPETGIYRFLEEVRASGQEVLYDARYTRRMVVLPDGHYAFRHSVWDLHLWRKKREPYLEKLAVLAEFAPILVDLPPRFYDIPTKAGIIRRLFSWHLLQPFAASHLKVGVVRYKSGEKAVSISTGELNSDGRQNNLTLTLAGNDKAYAFVQRALSTGTRIAAKGWGEEEIAPDIYLVVDYGNYGRPGQRPRIHEEAEEMIGGAKEVYFLSQYVPVGKILRALSRAADGGAKVAVNLEPRGDYRRGEMGFRILMGMFNAKRSKKIKTRTLRRPSHVKCLIVVDADGAQSMIFGSDNFDSLADKFYRNTELSILIRRVFPGSEGYGIIEAMKKALRESGDLGK
jgi:hypothetical protein